MEKERVTKHSDASTVFGSNLKQIKGLRFKFFLNTQNSEVIQLSLPHKVSSKGILNNIPKIKGDVGGKCGVGEGSYIQTKS